MGNTEEAVVSTGILTYFSVKGYKPMRGEVEEFYKALEVSEVYSLIAKTPVEVGGFVRYTVEEVEGVPEGSQMSCPSCEHQFDDPRRVILVEPSGESE